MKIIGIIAEYNPFHTGHIYQISETRKRFGEDAAIICIMSGNWTQQANCAIADKWTRARLALLGGADLIIELPTLWSTASAERFARGGVSLLAATGVVDHISFGSECGNTDILCSAAQCLESPEYAAHLRRLLPQGIPFAVCRQKAVESLAGKEIGDLLRYPNNNLGIEYIRALRSIKSSISPFTVPRTGARHGDCISFPPVLTHTDPDITSLFHAQNPFLSATSIRHHLTAGRWDLIAPYLPEGGQDVLRGNAGGLASLKNAERAILARLRSMTADDWSLLPDSAAAEGLPQRLAQAARSSSSMESFLLSASTKRYTNARLQRLVLWAFLGLTNTAFQRESPPYLRILGCNKAGRSVLKSMKQFATLPFITKPAHIRELDEQCRSLFELESRCTDLYDLCLPNIPSPGREWNSSPVLL